MTGWADGPMVAFDVESSGVDVESDRIVTACVAWVQTPQPEKPISWLLNPGLEIPAEATAVHGITTERARAEGKDPRSALPAIREKLISAWELGYPVVAYNAPYDLTILDRESRRHGFEGFHAIGLVIDPLVLDRHVDRYRRGSRKLTAACEHYRVRLDGAHDSTQDALAAARVAWRIGRQYPEIGELDWDDLFALQVEAHRAWAVEFEAYLTRKGTPERIDASWPLRQVPAVVAS